MSNCEIDFECDEKPILKNEEKKYVIYNIKKYKDWLKEKIDKDYETVSVEELLELLNKKRGYHLRCNPSKKYILYGDVDHYKKGFNNFKELYIPFMRDHYDIEIKDEDIMYTSNRGKEGSYHYSIPKYNCTASKQKEMNENFFKKYLNEFYNKKDNETSIDRGVYTTRFFRYPNQLKENKKDTEHIIKKGSIIDFIVEKIPNDSINVENKKYIDTEKSPVNKSKLKPINTKTKSNTKANIKTIKDTLIEQNNGETTDPIDEQDDEDNDIKKRIIEKHDILKLLDILKESRSDDRDSWCHVGMMLKNSSSSENEKDYLECWIEFSKKCPKKYNKDICIREWNGYRRGLGLYTISSLYYWAKQDNPKQYKKIMKERYKLLYSEIDISELETHDLYAKLLYDQKRDTLVCIKENPMIWYTYENGIWLRLEGVSKIKNYLIDEVIPIICKMKGNIDDEIVKLSCKEKDKLNNLVDKQLKYIKGITKLKNENFSTSVIIQSMRFFKDQTFYEKLDSLDDILSLGEYVYDLNTCNYRKAEPTDYCSLHTKVTYDEIKDLSEKDLESTYKILKDIFYYYDEKDNCEKTDLYEYMMNCLPELLMGYNKRQIFYIWTGIGRNGKGLLTAYLEAALGGYYENK